MNMGHQQLYQSSGAVFHNSNDAISRKYGHNWLAILIHEMIFFKTYSCIEDNA